MKVQAGHSNFGKAVWKEPSEDAFKEYNLCVIFKQSPFEKLFGNPDTGVSTFEKSSLMDPVSYLLCSL